MNNYTDATVETLRGLETASKTWRPIQTLSVVDTNVDTVTKLQKLVHPPTPAGQQKVVAGVPGGLVSFFATESPSKQQGRTVSEVSVSFTFDVNNPQYATTRIWIAGYQGNPNPVLQTSAVTGPISFILETTHEVITVIGQPVGQDGSVIPLNFCLSSAVTLDGVVSPPPSPTIAQTLVAIPLGYQFAYNQVNVGSTEDVIDSYRIYRGTTNVAGSATLLRVIKHDPTATGAVVVQDIVGGGQTFYYFVSAVNTQALESGLVSAQSGAIVSNPIDPSGGDLGAKGSAPPTFSGAFGWTTAAGSATIYWDGTHGSDALVIRRADTTTTTPSGGTGLTVTIAAGTYYAYPYYDELSGNVLFVTGGSGTSSLGAIFFAAPDPALAQTQALFGHVPLTGTALGPIVVGSAGTGSGGGSGKCVRDDQIVDVARDGQMLKPTAASAEIGDLILGPSGREVVVHVERIPCRTFIALDFDLGESVVVAPGHEFELPDGSSKRADEISLGEIMVVRRRHLATLRALRVVSGEYKVLITTAGPTHIFYAGVDDANVAVHNVILGC